MYRSGSTFQGIKALRKQRSSTRKEGGQEHRLQAGNSRSEITEVGMLLARTRPGGGIQNLEEKPTCEVGGIKRMEKASSRKGQTHQDGELQRRPERDDVSGL